MYEKKHSDVKLRKKKLSNIFDLSNYNSTRKVKEFYSTQKIFKREIERELSRRNISYDMKVDCIVLTNEDNNNALNIMSCILYQLYDLDLEDVFIFKKDNRKKSNAVLLYKECVMKKLKLAK